MRDRLADAIVKYQDTMKREQCEQLQAASFVCCRTARPLRKLRQPRIRQGKAALATIESCPGLYVTQAFLAHQAFAGLPLCFLPPPSEGPAASTGGALDVAAACLSIHFAQSYTSMVLDVSN